MSVRDAIDFTPTQVIVYRDALGHEFMGVASRTDADADAARVCRLLIGRASREAHPIEIDEDGDGQRVTTLDTRTDDVDGELRRVAEAKEALVRDGAPSGDGRTR